LGLFKNFSKISSLMQIFWTLRFDILATVLATVSKIGPFFYFSGHSGHKGGSGCTSLAFLG
jgi:hypothetical protein